jgi:ribosomal protein S27AE
MFDNSPEENDGGIAPEAAEDICEILIGSTFSLRTVIEETFGWECSPDLVAAVLERANQCLRCGLWMAACNDRNYCVRCASARAKTMPPVNPDDLQFTGDDVHFLSRLGVTANGALQRSQDRIIKAYAEFKKWDGGAGGIQNDYENKVLRDIRDGKFPPLMSEMEKERYRYFLQHKRWPEE